MSNPNRILDNTVEANADFARRTREKWREVPATRTGRAFSADLLEWPDNRLLEYWEEARRQVSVPEVRGWFQERYAEEFRGRDVADVGPGIGIEGIHFAQHGARITFVDIVEENLVLLRRLCELKGIEADFYYIDDFFHYHFSKQFDAFMFIGSMHHAPFDFSKRQAAAMTLSLRSGGRIIMLAYPKERFLKSGARDFAEFAKKTDGERTPWAEWYDKEKVRELFGPEFQVNWNRNFGMHQNDFIWFDLTKASAK